MATYFYISCALTVIIFIIFLVTLFNSRNTMRDLKQAKADAEYQLFHTSARLKNEIAISVKRNEHAKSLLADSELQIELCRLALDTPKESDPERWETLKELEQLSRKQYELQSDLHLGFDVYSADSPVLLQIATRVNENSTQIHSVISSKLAGG